MATTPSHGKAASQVVTTGLAPRSAGPHSPNLLDDKGNSNLAQLQDITSPSLSQTRHGPSLRKRRRVSRACDECRRKKIKCDGGQPCTHCTAYSYECTYDQPSNRRKHPTQQYVEVLELRLQRAESALNILAPGADLNDANFDMAIQGLIQSKEQTGRFRNLLLATSAIKPNSGSVSSQKQPTAIDDLPRSPLDLPSGSCISSTVNEEPIYRASTLPMQLNSTLVETTNASRSSLEARRVSIHAPIASKFNSQQSCNHNHDFTSITDMSTIGAPDSSCLEGHSLHAESQYFINQNPQQFGNTNPYPDYSAMMLPSADTFAYLDQPMMNFEDVKRKVVDITMMHSSDGTPIFSWDNGPAVDGGNGMLDGLEGQISGMLPPYRSQGGTPKQCYDWEGDDAIEDSQICDKWPLPLRTACESPWGKYEKVYDNELGGAVVVAVRITSPVELVHVRAFSTEASARTLHLFRQLRHQSIVTALEAFTTDNGLYVILEHMSISLERIIRSPAYPDERQVAAILGQVVAGVAYLAAEGFEHGSLTCSNILLNTIGDVKITNQECCQDILGSKGQRRDIKALSVITMKLIHKYVEVDEAVGVDNLPRWPLNSDALTFLSATTSAASAAELLKVVNSLSTP